MPVDRRLLNMEVNQLASLPTIFARINEAVNSPGSSMGDIARVISEDSGLSARLLRLANSAFYGFPAKIETITHALTVIGTQQVRDLALATSVMTAFGGIPKELIDMRAFWSHSLVCGVAARVLATQRRESNAERYFVAGVLHDIGRLLIFQNQPDLAKESLRQAQEENALLPPIEKQRFGIDHATLGGSLLSLWKLPPSLEEMVACHHRPLAAARYPEGAAIIHLADILAHVMELGFSGEIFIPPLDQEAWNQLGLSASVFSLVMDQIELQYNSVLQIILQYGES